MIWKRVVQGLCWFFGIIAPIVGLSIFLLGAKAVFGYENADASVDSELRFVSVFWAAFGLFCLWVVQDLSSRGHFIPAISALMFFGGIGRMISLMQVGAPHTVYVYGAWLELTIGTIWYVAFKGMSGK